MKNEPYILLDVQGLLQKFYHAGADPDALVDDEGNTVNTGEYGVARFLEMQLLGILDLVPPRRVIALWDGGNQYRRGLCPGYKKKRSEKIYTKTQTEQKDRLFSLAKSLMASLGVLQAKCNRAEADDLIALLCERLHGDKVVYTIDADLLQLSNDSTTVMLDGIVVEDYKGTPFHLIRLHKALIGDSSDEYVGVLGFGQAKWDEMVELFGWDGMEEVNACIAEGKWDLIEQAYAETKNKGCGLILENWSALKTSYHIAGLHPSICEGNYNGTLQEIKWFRRLPSEQRLKNVLSQLGADNLYSRMDKFMPTQTLVTADNLSVLREVKAELKNTPFVGFDFETYDPNPHKPFRDAASGDFVDLSAQIPTGASFTYGSNLQHTIYVSVAHADTNNAPADSITWLLKEVADAGLPLVIQNTQFELCVADLQLDYELQNTVDTRLESLALDEDELPGLKDQSKRHLSYDQATYKETVGDKAHMANLSGTEVMAYGCDDAFCTAHLHDLYQVRLQIERLDGFMPYEHAANKAFYEIYREGMRIDWDRLDVMAKEDAAEAKAGETRLRELLAEHCSEQSEKRMGELYAELSMFKEASMREQGKDEVAIAKALANMKDNLLVATQYVPYKEIAKTQEFKATPSVLTKVAESLGLPAIEKVTKKYLTEWLYDNSGHEFCNKLAAAAHQLADRAGEEYVALADFCAEHVPSHGKVEKLGTELNLGSPVQNQHLMYCLLNFPIRVRSKVLRGTTRDRLRFDGAPATDDAAINMALAEDCVAGEWRIDALRSLKSVKECTTREGLYWSKYPLWKHPGDGNIHGQLKNMGTVTRRPTGASPNFLQLTSKDGGRVRSMILPLQDDHVIISPDYNGEELRYTASMSKDPVMIDAYIGDSRKDLHSITASAIAPVQLLRDNPEVMERMERQNDGGLLYADFVAGLNGEFDDTTLCVSEVLKNIRKTAKSCIAEGSPVLTDRGLVPIESVRIADKVWDGVEFVRHEGVVYKGDKEVIFYDGLWATPDHEVYLDDGRKVQMVEATGKLAVGEVGGCAVYFLPPCSVINSGKIGGSVKLRIAKVYDIVNAGPRHRFTVSGKIVANCNFLLIYAGGPHTLAKKLGIPTDVASAFFEMIFNRYKRLKPWQQESIAFAREHGYALTAWGNRRHLPGILSDDDSVRAACERQAVNSQVQGTGSDQLKLALYAITSSGILNDTGSKLLLPPYDEIAISVPRQHAVEVSQEVLRLMSITPPGHIVPQVPELKLSARNWGDVGRHELGANPSEAEILAALEA